jgi:hypothetical protein
MIIILACPSKLPQFGLDHEDEGIRTPVELILHREHLITEEPEYRGFSLHQHDHGLIVVLLAVPQQSLHGGTIPLRRVEEVGVT